MMSEFICLFYASPQPVIKNLDIPGFIRGLGASTAELPVKQNLPVRGVPIILPH